MSRPAALLLALGVITFAGVTTAVGMASGAPTDFLVLDALLGGTFVLAGLWAAWLRPALPAGPLLLISGGLWFVGSYAPTGQPVVTHLGFAFERYYYLALAALLLMLLEADHVLRPRALIGALAVAMGARSAGRLLLQDPVRLSPDCTGCPANPLALWPDLGLFRASEVITNGIITVLVVAVAIVALRRLRAAGPVARRANWPVLAAGGLAMGFAAGDTLEYAWTTATDTPLFELGEPWAAVFGWLGFVATALVPLAFLVGTLRMRSMAGPLAPFATEVGKSGTLAGLGDALRAALGDPSLELMRSLPGGAWMSESGRTIDRLEPGAGRVVTAIGGGERPLAAIIHDPALRDHPELLDAVVTVLRLALENERLEAEVREQLRSVTESRARIVGAVEQERRRLERDLHDGAQQRLVAVALRLQEARSAADTATVPSELRRRLDAIAEELGLATHELREFARGIHPAILTDEGIGPAVASLARRSAIPVDVRVELEGRLPMAIESTAYFTVAEALTNTQRHAQANLATVRLSQRDGEVRIEIADDGRGGADPARGSGLRGLADRVTALGGTFAVTSEDGQGTRIRAAIPVR